MSNTTFYILLRATVHNIYCHSLHKVRVSHRGKWVHARGVTGTGQTAIASYREEKVRGREGRGYAGPRSNGDTGTFPTNVQFGHVTNALKQIAINALPNIYINTIKQKMGGGEGNHT